MKEKIIELLTLISIIIFAFGFITMGIYLFDKEMAIFKIAYIISAVGVFLFIGIFIFWYDEL